MYVHHMQKSIEAQQDIDVYVSIIPKFISEKWIGLLYPFYTIIIQCLFLLFILLFCSPHSILLFFFRSLGK